MKKQQRFPVIICGGNGYVSGELLRLLSVHPRFSVECVTSTSHAGEQLLTHFPQLRGFLDDSTVFAPFSDLRTLFKKHKRKKIGVFLATPHGATSGLAFELTSLAKVCGTTLKFVDLSADFRFSDTERYTKIYKAVHEAPELQSKFSCSCPDLSADEPTTPHVAHPGCFTTAVTLASYPFFHEGVIEPNIFVSAVTGSSGSGRKPIAGTHHPERHSTMLAYSPLAHRHEAEMRILLGQANAKNSLSRPHEPDVDFVPHSGAFVRGIHATIQMRLKRETSAKELVKLVNDFYSHTPFVEASTQPPRLVDIAGTNRCHIGISTRGRTLVVLSAIDNMVKGSAGGGVQWMNKLFGLPAETGLMLPGLGWY